ncbi:MAG: site-2 protease family protein, partial [Ktedonobacteraceae bacterium]|nr:site-2 protease family protein [Ktedonobacteraceae bacterium]
MQNSINVVLAFMLIASFLVAMMLHECGHALAASLLGDPTPRDEGRQSLRLSFHIDPVGTLLCVILAFFPMGAFPIGLGWGKPVKPDPWKMRVGANTGVLIVACSGLFTSLLIGIAAALLTHFLVLATGVAAANFLVQRLLQLLTVFAMVNIGLAIFNILPIYPLDGYQIL